MYIYTLHKLYKIFTYKWKANHKNKRIGILWSSIFFFKFNDNQWTDKDNQIFLQIKNISKQLMDESKNNDKNVLHDFVPKCK